MGRRGPRPADPKLKVLRGERADRLPTGGPPAADGRPEPPDWLDDVARGEWDRLLPQLVASGVLARVDGAALAIYCTVFSRWQTALADVQKFTVTASTDAGSPKANPAVAVAAGAEAQMARLLAEFGATPASRGRVKVPEKPPADPLAEMLARRKA